MKLSSHHVRLGTTAILKKAEALHKPLNIKSPKQGSQTVAGTLSGFAKTTYSRNIPYDAYSIPGLARKYSEDMQAGTNCLHEIGA